MPVFRVRVSRVRVSSGQWLLVSMLLLFGLAAHAAATFKETDWLELMPPDEVEAMLNASQSGIIDHSMKGSQHGTFRTIPEMDGKKLKMAGYVVPMEFTDDGKVKEFYFVPYFGACIHMPPPPPNQLILARLSKPIDPPDIYEAFWVSGTLKIERTESDMAETAYAMDVADIRLYE